MIKRRFVCSRVSHRLDGPVGHDSLHLAHQHARPEATRKLHVPATRHLTTHTGQNAAAQAKVTMMKIVILKILLLLLLLLLLSS
jgi:hypothetical protein